MRLAFPNGEHDEVSVGKGTLSIGSSPGDNVILSAGGVDPGHAVIIVDRRGITLNVDSKSGKVTVNGRPVVERAILRLGDHLGVGPVAILLRAEQDQIQAAPDTSGSERAPAEGSSPKYHLRGINGYHRGRIIPILGRLTVGRDEACDLVIPDAELAPELARIEVDSGGMYARPADDQTLDINGNQVGEVILNPGDQLSFGTHRFLVETPGFVPGKAYVRSVEESAASSTQVFASPVIEEQPEGMPQDREDDGFNTGASGRDAVVVAVCVLLSAAMLIWLFFLS